jgi:putative nucleotidyltransferase with HDIG domain
MVTSMIDNPDALLWVGRMRDEDINTYNHGVKVALYLIALGRQIGFPKKELSHLGLIGMLADVGKMKLPRALLDKPGMLAPAEHEMMKNHVRLGLEALRGSGALPAEVAQGIAQHHERLDGSGYPKGLKGNAISIYGRMAAIADSFAALITPRAYANPLAPQDALMNLYEWAGTSFHEPLVEQFVQAVGVFPVGSLVELSSGEIAVVVVHNRVRRLEPRVLLLTGPDKAPLAEPVERDLLAQGKSEQGRVRIVRGLPAGAYGLKLRDYYMTGIARANELHA